MSTSELVCLFHNRKYSSNIQCILNILHKNFIRNNFQLNKIAKNLLCICSLSVNEISITNEEFENKKQEFDKFQIKSWFEQVKYIIEINIIPKCNNKICLYKLYDFICQINQKNDLQSSNILSTVHKISSNNMICRQIELTTPSNALGLLLGRNGIQHKTIMSETNTKIHFENAPYSLKSKNFQQLTFDLDLFQSSDPLRVKITGKNVDDVQKAIQTLQELDQRILVENQ